MAFFSTLLRPEFAQSSLLVIIYLFIIFIMLTGSLILLEKPVDMSITFQNLIKMQWSIFCIENYTVFAIPLLEKPVPVLLFPHL